MRLLIVGTLRGQLSTATKIAMDRGAAVTHAESIDQALAVLRSGKGADLLETPLEDLRTMIDAWLEKTEPPARSAAADAPYRPSMSLDRHPANCMRPPSEPCAASHSWAKVWRNRWG